MITRFFCRKSRDYALFGVEFWQKFLEILRFLAEILRKKLASGASALRNPSILLFALWQQVQQVSKPVEAQKEMPTASEARTFAGHSCGWDFAGQGGEGGGG